MQLMTSIAGQVALAIAAIAVFVVLYVGFPGKGLKSVVLAVAIVIAAAFAFRLLR